MKLSKFIKYIDDYTDCIIWGANTPEDEFKVIFEGCIFEIPTKISEGYELIKAKNNCDERAAASVTLKGGNLMEGQCTDMRFTVVKKQ